MMRSMNILLLVVGYCECVMNYICVVVAGKGKSNSNCVLHLFLSLRSGFINVIYYFC